MSDPPSDPSVVDGQDIEPDSVVTDEEDITGDKSGASDDDGHLVISRSGTNGDDGDLIVTDSGQEIAQDFPDINNRMGRHDASLQLNRNAEYSNGEWGVEDDQYNGNATIYEVGGSGFGFFSVDGGSAGDAVDQKMRLWLDGRLNLIESMSLGFDIGAGHGDGLHVDTGKTIVKGASSEETDSIQTYETQILGIDPDDAGMLLARYNNGAGGVQEVVSKSRSGSINTVGTAVQDGDTLWTKTVTGDDGNNFGAGREAFRMQVDVNGTPTFQTVPADVSFLTQDSNGDLTTALIIDRGQNLKTFNGDLEINPNSTNPGASSNPVVEIGDGGAGFFIDSGEVKVVDESGNVSTLS